MSRSLVYGLELPSLGNSKIRLLLGCYLIALVSSISAMQLFAALLALILLIYFSRRLLSGESSAASLAIGLEVLFLIYIATSVLGLVVNPDTVTGEIDWKQLTKLTWIFHFYLMVNLFRLQFFEKKYAVILLVAASLAALHAFLQYFTGYDLVRDVSFLHKFGERFRAQGFFSNPMTFAHSFAMIFFLPFCWLLVRFQQSKRISPLVLGCCLLLGSSVFLSQTRGAWMAIGFGVVVVSLVSGRKLAMSVLGTISAVFITTLYFSLTLRERFFSIFDLTFSNNSTRLGLWKTNLEIFLDNPILGVGIGQNSKHLLDYYDRLGIHSDFVSHAHNNLIQFLATTGLFATVLFYFIAASMLFLALGLFYRIPEGNIWLRTLALSSFGAQVAFHVGGMTECNFIDTEVNHVFLLYWAITIVLADSYGVARLPTSGSFKSRV